MKTDLTEIQSTLHDLLREAVPPLQVRVETDANFEVAGTKEAMQGKKKVEGYYFSSVMPKPKDIRWYFFPLYTHAEAYPELSPELKKCLKGKTCFHIKKLSPGMEAEIQEMITLALKLYSADGLI